ncbi:hypothetical protein EDD37DRAFT_609445 [Exophiala viscosa]|uniref:uncharacterized protein n=1 Tax=Exophiala viscosa TaxID=2486360 RepID=UPI002194494C|nr:hypothetical protein EDD37DRAFT_609445 [Exophiala viscosa]
MTTDGCPDCTVFSYGLAGRGAHLAIPSIVAPVLAFLLVSNRVYWRCKLVGGLGPDDLWTLLALVCFIAQCGSTIAAVNFGYGRPMVTMTPDQASLALKCFFLLQIFYKLTINCTKVSILLLYLRIFTDRAWFGRICRGLIVLVLCACVSFTIATILQCDPIAGAWTRWTTHSHCVNIYALWYSNAVYNILTDLTIAFMVPPIIFKLKLPMRQKLALTGIFGLGVIVCAASISRLTTLYSSADGNDPTAGSFISTIWTSIEAGLGIICANLPMLRTPLQHFFPKIFPPRSRTNQLSSTSQIRPSEGSDGCILVMTATMDETPVCYTEPTMSCQTPAIDITQAPPSHRRNREMNEMNFPTGSTMTRTWDGCDTQQRPSSSRWRTYNHNHAEGDASWYHRSHKVW